MPITSIKLINFKTFKEFSVSLRSMNIFVGPNNSGKSTILSAFRVLEYALRTCQKRKPTSVTTHTGQEVLGHKIPLDTIPISLENVHHNYSATDTRIEFRYSGSNLLILHFPEDGGVVVYWDTTGRTIISGTGFRSAFPDKVQVIPVLGPLEQNEQIVTDETVRRSAGTPRASRHFRNYWWKNSEGFEEFSSLIQKTWPGMSIEPPKIESDGKAHYTMFALENRIPRELYWSGLGFQVWCQLLTHISRCNQSNLLIVDEPEVYLHPEVQRQLVTILREVKPDILMATHSVEIISEADSSEILLVEKKKRSAQRLNDIQGVQQAIDNIGSIQNVLLTELARNRRILFVEGTRDYRIIKRFAKRLGYDKLASGSGLTPFESGGFDSWRKVQGLAWGLREAIGTDVKIATVYDRDYRCDDECKKLENDLEQEIELAYFHKREEIENYLLSATTLRRAVENAIKDRAQRRGEKPPKFHLKIRSTLDSLTSEHKSESQGQYISKYCSFFRHSGKDQATLTTEAVKIFEVKWDDLETRLEIIPGKKVLKNFREKIQRDYGVTLTDFRLVDAFLPNEIPVDFVRIVEKLDIFRNDSG